MTGTIRQVFADQEGLRQHLDNLNERGESPIAVGIDNTPQPFLITLIGPYAEGEAVFFDSPWQSDTDHGKRENGVWVPKKPHCTDCNGMEYGIEDLRFPVTVLVITTMKVVKGGTLG